MTPSEMKVKFRIKGGGPECLASSRIKSKPASFVHYEVRSGVHSECTRICLLPHTRYPVFLENNSQRISNEGYIW